MELEGVHLQLGRKLVICICILLIYLLFTFADEDDGLDWPIRYKIIKGTCEGLKHLHVEMNPPIYHLDLKPANILLDNNMVPKIADFGLSRFITEEKTMITKNLVGTL